MTRITFAFALTALGILPAIAQTPACPVQPKSPDAMMAVLRPVMQTHTLPPYPPLSVAMGEGGTTLLEVIIGADGKVMSDKVISSSGSVRLDEAAAEHVKQNWLWNPVLPNGCAQVLTRVSIKWDVRDAVDDGVNPVLETIIATKADYPADALKRLEQGWTFVGFYLGKDARMMFPKVLRGSGFADLDAKALDLVKAHHWAPGSMDGKPVTTVIELLVEWTIDGTPPPPPPR